MMSHTTTVTPRKRQLSAQQRSALEILAAAGPMAAQGRLAHRFSVDVLADLVHDGLATALLVFLVLFFANFVVSWIAVILVMDGALKDAQGRQHQLDIERSGRRAMNEADARRRG
jgi:hypothetical protein